MACLRVDFEVRAGKGRCGRGCASAWAWGLAMVLGGATAALGQMATSVVMPRGPLLPDKFGSFVQSGVGAGPTDAAPMSAAGAEVLKEDGVQRSSHATYGKVGGGAGTVTVDAIQFEDATGAASAYSYLRGAGMREFPAGKGIGPESAREGDRWIFREGPSVVEAEVRGASAEDLKRLSATLPKIGGPRGLPPMLPTYLPTEGLVPESLHYAVGPVGYQAMGGALPVGAMGFEKSAEVVTARYVGKGMVTLLLYPTPQIAGDRGRAVAAQMGAGTVAMRREGPLVMLATGGFSKDEAERLLRGIHLRTELTWNKKMPLEFHAEVQKTASLLVNIAVLSGVLGLAALLLGLFLGFGRAWIRVLMGKPAAIEPEFLRLNLSRGGRGDPQSKV